MKCSRDFDAIRFWKHVYDIRMREKEKKNQIMLQSVDSSVCWFDEHTERTVCEQEQQQQQNSQNQTDTSLLSNRFKMI